MSLIMALEFFCGIFASSFVQGFADRLTAAAADKLAQFRNSDIEMELKNLRSTCMKIQCLLNKIDGWDLISREPHRDWLADVWRGCYDAEDYAERLKLDILSSINSSGCLSSFWTKLCAPGTISRLQSELDRLIDASDNYTFTSRLDRNPGSTLGVDGGSFIRKRDKEDIVRFLRVPSPTPGKGNKIVLISGMFGLGKSVLARAVMDHTQFLLFYRLWVSIGGDFDPLQTSRSIKNQVDDKAQEFTTLNLFPKAESARASLQEKRVLVVLDDLQRFAKNQDWEDFQSLLNPSYVYAIIITTRNPQVSKIVASFSEGPVLTRYLKPMSDEECASLVLQKVGFASANSSSKRKHCQSSSEQRCALELAQKFCKGLPLVADIISYRLCHSEAEPLENMLCDDLWELKEFKRQIFPAFRLNYSDLSTFLRRCLPYLSLFPVNYCFTKDELVHLWRAEGFIKPQVAENQQFECSSSNELPSDRFDEVLSHSVLQTDDSPTQEPQIYKMHDFIHRYAGYIGCGMFIRIDQQYVDDNGRATRLRKARHISFLCPSIGSGMWQDIANCQGLRTILNLHGSTTEIGELSSSLFLKLEWLRVLVLSRTDITQLPESLGKLKHLRHLDVSNTGIAELPQSTAHLLGLEVLKLNNCEELRQLPKDIRNLTQLIHLEVDMMPLLSKPSQLGKLTKLRTLRAFAVYRDDGHQVTELKNMKHLQGSIRLANLENVESEAEARAAMLSEKPFLRRVELLWRRSLAGQPPPDRILAGLEPHENLKELQVIGYGGVRFPGWLRSPECKLLKIHLQKCNRCHELPALGQLPNLKALHMEEMDSVKYMDHQFSESQAVRGFPTLESLKLENMTSLEKWEGLRAKQMPHLRDLVIIDCPNLRSLPGLNLLTSLETLEITDCPALEALPRLPSSVEKLRIAGCDLLTGRCQRGRGADWDKIKKIREIYIDFVRMSSVA